jgi:hypothetical protein
MFALMDFDEVIVLVAIFVEGFDLGSSSPVRRTTGTDSQDLSARW